MAAVAARAAVNVVPYDRKSSSVKIECVLPLSAIYSPSSKGSQRSTVTKLFLPHKSYRGDTKHPLRGNCFAFLTEKWKSELLDNLEKSDACGGDSFEIASGNKRKRGRPRVNSESAKKSRLGSNLAKNIDNGPCYLDDRRWALAAESYPNILDYDDLSHSFVAGRPPSVFTFPVQVDFEIPKSLIQKCSLYVDWIDTFTIDVLCISEEIALYALKEQNNPYPSERARIALNLAQQKGNLRGMTAERVREMREIVDMDWESRPTEPDAEKVLNLRKVMMSRSVESVKDQLVKEFMDRFTTLGSDGSDRNGGVETASEASGDNGNGENCTEIDRTTVGGTLEESEVQQTLTSNYKTKRVPRRSAGLLGPKSPSPKVRNSLQSRSTFVDVSGTDSSTRSGEAQRVPSNSQVDAESLPTPTWGAERCCTERNDVFCRDSTSPVTNHSEEEDLRPRNESEEADQERAAIRAMDKGRVPKILSRHTPEQAGADTLSARRQQQLQQKNSAAHPRTMLGVMQEHAKVGKIFEYGSDGGLGTVSPRLNPKFTHGPDDINDLECEESTQLEKPSSNGSSISPGTSAGKATQAGSDHRNSFSNAGFDSVDSSRTDVDHQYASASSSMQTQADIQGTWRQSTPKTVSLPSTAAVSTVNSPLLSLKSIPSVTTLMYHQFNSPVRPARSQSGSVDRKVGQPMPYYSMSMIQDAFRRSLELYVPRGLALRSTEEFEQFSKAVLESLGQILEMQASGYTFPDPTKEPVMEQVPGVFPWDAVGPVSDLFRVTIKRYVGESLAIINPHEFETFKGVVIRALGTSMYRHGRAAPLRNA
ncbi:hypothetical protein BJ742DRAFT_795148 [Cladochytrium replicatum]|nr:hypothetical protein BJ742DRAFT_795148 [Cladochytrium replicatum]